MAVELVVEDLVKETAAEDSPAEVAAEDLLKERAAEDLLAEVLAEDLLAEVTAEDSLDDDGRMRYHLAAKFTSLSCQIYHCNCLFYAMLNFLATQGG